VPIGECFNSFPHPKKQVIAFIRNFPVNLFETMDFDGFEIALLSKLQVK